MSLLTRIGDLITAIGADIKSLQDQITSLSPSGTVVPVSATLTGVQANSTVTPVVVTGHTFTVPAGKKMKLSFVGSFTSANTGTGLAIGVRTAQGAGANNTVIGAAQCMVAITSAAAASALRTGGKISAAAGANQFIECLGTAVNATSAEHSCNVEIYVHNRATNAASTVTIEFRSETAGTSVTMSVGSGALGTIVP